MSEKQKKTIFKRFLSLFVEPTEQDDEDLSEYEPLDGFTYSDGSPDLFDDDTVPAGKDEPLEHLFSDDELEYSEEQDIRDADSLYWENGEPVVSDIHLFGEDAPSVSSDDTDFSDFEEDLSDKAEPEELKQEQPEEINLFDDDSDEPPRQFSGRTRIFRPSGNRTPVSVNVNTTKASRSVEEAEKKKREIQAQKQHEIYKKKKQRRKKVRNFFTNFSLNLVFGLFLLICLAAALYFTFLLSDIIITGNEQYSSEYIAELSGLEIGKHMIFQNLNEAKANIESNPYLKVEDITYIFPSRVRISVAERHEIAGIVGLDYNVIIDEDGYVLSMSGEMDISDLLEVTGMSMTGFKLGERIGESSDFATATLISIIQKLEEYELSNQIRSIDLTTPLAIVMYTRSGFKIFIGQPTDLDKKFSSLSILLPKFMSSGVTTGTLYLSAKGGTVYSPPSSSVLPGSGGMNPVTGLAPGSNPEETPPPENTEGTEPGVNTEETPEPVETPVPIQPGGGDDFQG